MINADDLRAAIEAIPDHYMGGYECEWDCEHRHDSPRYPRQFPDCAWDSPEHAQDLISRDRVLALLGPFVSRSADGTATASEASDTETA